MPILQSCPIRGGHAEAHNVAQVHLAWIKTPRNKGGLGHIKIPIIADVKKVCGILHLLSRCLYTVAFSV